MRTSFIDDNIIKRVEDEVLRRLSTASALLIGAEPPEPLGFRYVDGPPYDAVLIGSLEPGELLCFRDERVLEALLEGVPVYLWEPGLRHKTFSHTTNRQLFAKLQTLERELRRLGIRFLGRAERRLVTAEQAQSLAAQGLRPPEGAVLTPLAREILGNGG